MSNAKELTAALERLQKNNRVTLIRIQVADDACPVCLAQEGAYPKDQVPVLPPDGCSCPHGRARVNYAPVLAEIYP